eukprot:10496120-Karenia_brevis.AAC.1
MADPDEPECNEEQTLEYEEKFLGDGVGVSTPDHRKVDSGGVVHCPMLVAMACPPNEEEEEETLSASDEALAPSQLRGGGKNTGSTKKGSLERRGLSVQGGLASPDLDLGATAWQCRSLSAQGGLASPDLNMGAIAEEEEQKEKLPEIPPWP